MRSRSYRHTRSGSRHGIALVIVLAFIVLLTILILSFTAFSRLNRLSTVSYSKAVQAQEIAQGGLQDVLDDLHKEILAGSTITTTGSGSYASIYVPNTNLTAVPARIGFSPASWGTDTTPTTLSPTLVRVSRATGNPNAVGGDGFFTLPPSYYNMANVPGGAIPNRASLASTAASSANGRSISTARWNKTFLLATNSAGVPSPFTGAPPDWVYVTRNGSRACVTTDVTNGSLAASNSVTNTYGVVSPGANPPAAPVVGRYAFVVYDEGALLDANVAGYNYLSTNLVSTPAVNNPAGISQAVYGKSYAAYSDLTQLPGFYTKAGRNTTPAQSQVDAFVNWRNGSAATTAGGAIPGANYLNAVFKYGQGGFLTFASNTTTGASDSPLVSRQDLINYFASIDPNINTTSATFSQALPYLGTFTRALTWPSWRPLLDSPNISPGTGSGYSPPATGGTSPVYYNKYCESALDNNSNPVANRDLANVRYPASATITHYADDGTTTTYTVAAGDPLLQHRFSLARINWLAGSPETGQSDATKTQAIKDCFGLQWTTSSPSTGLPCWEYTVHGTGTAPNMTIMTLDQVAAAGREPDFFELLKAAILSGSLGRDPGAVGQVIQPSSTRVWGPGGIDFDTTSAKTDMQILQIGANIIDQWDTDSYPTAIYFPGSGFTNTQAQNTPELQPINMVYGLENLPYINRIFDLAWVTNPTAPTTPSTFDVWYQPEFWNPFQVPTVTTNRPSSFCFRIHGTVSLIWSESFGAQTSKSNPPGTDPLPPSDPMYNRPAFGSGLNITTDFDDPTLPLSKVGSNDACLFFSDNNIPSTFANPQILVTPAAGAYTTALGAPLYSTEGASGTDPGNIAPAPPLVATQGGAYTGSYPYTVSYSTGNQFLGIHLGQMTNYSWSNNPALCGATTAWDQQTTLDNRMRIAIDPGVNGLTFCLMYYDGTQYLPYTYLSRYLGVYQPSYGTTAATGVAYGLGPDIVNVGTIADGVWGSDNPGAPLGHADPLTDRFSAVYDDGSHGAGGGPWSNRINTPGNAFLSPVSVGQPWESLNSSPFPCEGYGAEYGAPRTTSGFVYEQTGTTPFAVDASSNDGNVGFWIGNWAQNNQTVSIGGGAGQNFAYYADPDGVVRPGNDYYWMGPYGGPSGSVSAAMVDGMGQLIGGYSTTTGSGTRPATTVSRRPLILNRPFRSVGELGYVNRDLPFKSLDFFTPFSADAALLDVFGLTDEPTVMAGQVDISNAPLPVISAVIVGGNKQELTATDTVGKEAYSTTAPIGIAAKISTQLSQTAGSGPLNSRADLVTNLSTAIQSGYYSAGSSNDIYVSPDSADKTRIEAPIRALAGATNTRTWNLLIDIIAQSGQMSPTAATLNDFIVQGERRYWLHIAIDRYTGKIIDQQLEPVYE